MTMLTWDMLVAKEPRLIAIERTAARNAQDWPAWSAIKKSLVKLIGWDAITNDAQLATREAFEVAYDHLLRTWETTEREPVVWRRRA